MKLSVIFPALLLLIQMTACSQEMITIKGTLQGDSKGYHKVYIYQQRTGMDSTVISNNQFEFRVPYEPGMMPLLVTEYDIKVLDGHYLHVAIEKPGTLFLKNIDITKSLHSGTWSGMPSAQEYQAITRGLDVIEAEIKTLLDAKYGSGADSSMAYQKEEDSLSISARVLFLEAFAKVHPDSYGMMVFLNDVRAVTHIPPAAQEKIYNILSVQVRNSLPGKELGTFFLGLKNSGLGSSVKDFTLYTPSNVPIQFNSLKGKYVLIDFWASWCFPCRQSIPHLKEVYEKYKSDKFEIYSISVDENKEAWLKAVQKENMPWLQALDTIDVSTSSFGVQGLPTAFLIDPQGKVLIKERGMVPEGKSVIEHKLAELFNH